jgi:hypothetical protein
MPRFVYTDKALHLLQHFFTFTNIIYGTFCYQFSSACIQFSGDGEEAPQNLDTLQFWNSFQLLH